MNAKLSFLSALTVSILLTSQAAQADFRKALDAYIARDGITMLEEVKDAVEKKDDRALVLFLSMIYFDSELETSLDFIGDQEVDYISNLVKNEHVFKAPWQSILNTNDALVFMGLLDKATSESSLEAQFRLLQLRYGNIFNAGYINQIDNERNRKNKKQFIEGLADLAEKGYLPGIYFLAKYNYFGEMKKVPKLKNSTYWYQKLNELKLKPSNPNNYSGKENQPLISIHRFIRWDEGKSFVFNVTNYLIDIYPDGRVNFSLAAQLDKKQNTELISNLSQNSVNEIMTVFLKHNIQNIPAKNIGKYYLADDMALPPPNFHRHVPRQAYYVEIRDGKNNRTIKFLNSDQDLLPEFLVKILNAVEDKFPTQRFRCGSVSDRQYYRYCLEKN